MALKRFHDPTRGVLRVAGFMSGSGTNLMRILEHQERLKKEKGSSPYEVVVIFSDSAESNALKMGRAFDIPVVVRDLRGYCAKRGRPRRDMAARAAYDAETLRSLAPHGVTAAAFAGYMSIATPALLSKILAVNVHPADLSIKAADGSRRFKGDHAVADAIRAGEKTLASTTHIVEPEVDEGRILMISSPLSVEVPAGLSMERDLDAVAEANQERLKESGDWVIFPATLEMIALGRYARDDEGVIHFDEKPVPEGLRYGQFA
jgi:phosphoribosylglycinamide formyltransferase-1